MENHVNNLLHVIVKDVYTYKNKLYTILDIHGKYKYL